MMNSMKWLSQSLVGISGVCIVLMLILVVSDVLARALINVAIPGIDTIVASYLMVATIFLPLALLQILEENIAVDVLRDNVPDFMKDIFDIIAHILAVAFYGILGWIYFKVAVDAFEIREYVTGAWDVPIWPARVFMPIGLFFGSVAALGKLFLSIRDLFTGAPPPPHDSTGAFWNE